MYRLYSRCTNSRWQCSCSLVSLYHQRFYIRFWSLRGLLTYVLFLLWRAVLHFMQCGWHVSQCDNCDRLHNDGNRLVLAWSSECSARSPKKRKPKLWLSTTAPCILSRWSTSCKSFFNRVSVFYTIVAQLIAMIARKNVCFTIFRKKFAFKRNFRTHLSTIPKSVDVS